MKWIAVIFFLLLVPASMLGQDENPRNVKPPANVYSLFWAGVETSTSAYIDTKTLDSSGTQLYLAPYVNYYHKSGFGLQAKTYLFPGGSNAGFFMSSLSAYYARYPKTWRPYVSYTRYLYHDNPSFPYSPIQHECVAQVKRMSKWLDVTGGADLSFGRDSADNNAWVSDINLFMAGSHIFYASGSWADLALVPAIQLNAGTDRYFKYSQVAKYLRQGSSQGHGNGPGRGNSPAEYESIISAQNEFGLSNLELNGSVLLFIGDFSISPSASVFFPLRSGVSTYGYWQLNVNYYLD